MSDTVIEKKLLYLILISIAVHVAVIVVMVNLRDEVKPSSEPFMVDLDGIPALPVQKTDINKVDRFSEEQQRVEREVAPKGDALAENPPRGDSSLRPSQSLSDSVTKPSQQFDSSGREQSPREELFRKKERNQPSSIASFYPGAEKMARLEDQYRKKYGPEVVEGETKFLNTDDILFGSFLRRFETAVYGVWRYPQEAAKMGIEGVTPVKITFNRRGEIVGSEILQSSGSKILDKEVIRTLEKIGPIGSFPKGYEKETFNLIAFFHYGITQGATRSLR